MLLNLPPRHAESQRARLDYWVGLGLLALLLLLFAPVLMQPGSSPYDHDMDLFYGHEAVVRAALSGGEFPLWNPYESAGLPALANPQQGILYPPNWIGRLLEVPILPFLNWSLIAHLWLGGFGFYCFLRAEGLRPAAAGLGMLTWVLGGALLPRLIPGHVGWFQGIAWPGWILWALYRMLEKEESAVGSPLGSAIPMRTYRLRYALVLSLLLALFALSGHPQLILLAAALPGAYALYRVIEQARSGELRLALANLGLGLLAGLLAAGLLAIQLLPLAELSSLSGRGAGLSLEDATEYQLAPFQLLNPVLPTLWYAPGARYPLTLNASAGETTHSITGFYEAGMYIGLGGLLLAAYAALAPRHAHRGFSRVLLAMALIGLLLSLGRQTPFYEPLYRAASFLRAPVRFLLWWVLGLGWMAAYGLELLLSQAAAKTAAPWLRAGFSLHLAGAALGAAATLGWFLWIAPEIAPGTHPLDINVLLRDAFDHALVSFTLVASVWALAFGVAPRLRGQALAICLLAAALFDLTLFSQRLIYPHPAAALYANPDHPVAQLAGGPAGLRIASAADERLPMSYGIPVTAQGESLTLAAIQPLLDAEEPGWRVLGASYWLNLERDLVPIDAPWPRLYAAPALRYEPDALAATAQLLDPAFDPFALVLVQEEAASSLLPAVAEAAAFSGVITDYRMNSLRAAVETDRAVMVIFGETWYPDWIATVDGRPAPVYRVNGGFRAVCVEAGQHVIEMSYQPRPVWIGAWISAGAALLWIALAAAAWGWLPRVQQKTVSSNPVT